jgi:hypothetical protein
MNEKMYGFKVKLYVTILPVPVPVRLRCNLTERTLYRGAPSGGSSARRRRPRSSRARVLAQLQVHRIEVPRQVALRPKATPGRWGHAWSRSFKCTVSMCLFRVLSCPKATPSQVDARVRPHLLVDGGAVPPHVARRDEAAAAVRALVVAPPLVHCPAVPHHGFEPASLLQWGHFSCTALACASRLLGDGKPVRQYGQACLRGWPLAP